MSRTVTSAVVSAFLEPSNPRWTRFLAETAHDFYHLPSYARMSSKAEGGTPVAFYAEIGHSSFLLPLLIRTLPESLRAPKEWTDAASPYGYPGRLYPMQVIPKRRSCFSGRYEQRRPKAIS